MRFTLQCEEQCFSFSFVFCFKLFEKVFPSIFYFRSLLSDCCFVGVCWSNVVHDQSCASCLNGLVSLSSLC